MTKLWAKLVDTDGDNNLEVLQLSDVDPATLWHPDFLHQWQEVPADAAIGDILESSTKKWWKGADWLNKRLSEAAPAPVENLNPPKFKGAVTKIKIKNSGANYEIPFVRDQYDLGEGTGLVVSVTYNDVGSATKVDIFHEGRGYNVGQTFNIEQGFGRDWDRKNPTYTVLEVEEIYDAPDAIIPPIIEENP